MIPFRYPIKYFVPRSHQFIIYRKSSTIEFVRNNVKINSNLYLTDIDNLKFKSPKSSTIQNKTLMQKEKHNEDFFGTFPSFVNDLLESKICPPLTQSQKKRIQTLFTYNVSHGKNVRASLFLKTYLALRKNVLKLKEKELEIIFKIAWIFETHHSYACLLDDIVDDGKLRHGRPCWYTLRDVGPKDAIIDGLIMEHACFLLLQTYMQNKPYLLDILCLFHETNYRTTCGQLLDTVTSRNRNINEYNMDLYKKIVMYKTGYYTFYNPIAVAVTMNGFQSPELLSTLESLAMDFAMLFQIQDDFLDCFGDNEKFGKAGNDILERKCTWLLVTALEKATPQQRLILLHNFDRGDSSSVSKIKELYSLIEIPLLYSRCKEGFAQRILSRIESLPTFMPKSFLINLLQTLCNREY